MNPSRRPNQLQQAEMFQHIHEVADLLKEKYGELVKQAQMSRGLSSSSLTIMGSGGVSDPTGEAVVDDRPDPADWAKDCLTEIDAFYSLAKSVENRVRRLLPPEATGAFEAGCKSCARLPHNWSPVIRSERCKWCYNFWLAEKQDPPLPLLVKRKNGERISDRDVREALGRTA